jgi:hypothetical protein
MFRFTPTELRQRAALFWSSELTSREASASIIPLLLQTQGKFISLLDVADASPIAWRHVLGSTQNLSANVFLKHLMVLSDVGGELLKRLQPELPRIFPDNTIHYIWRENDYEYIFKTPLQKFRMDNKSLCVDGERLSSPCPLSDTMEDVVMLILHGGMTCPHFMYQGLH